LDNLKKIVEEVKKTKPKIIIANVNYYGIFLQEF
jgi:cystathionine beta-lyase family protein involved in aluminum resistance